MGRLDFREVPTDEMGTTRGSRRKPSPQEVALFANEFLSLHDHPDYGPMGAQVLGNSNVTGIAAAVSVNCDVIKTAHERGCNMLIVHHGTFWNNESRLSEHWLRRYALLDSLDMSLLAYHLALDAHPKIGNNILAARKLGLGHLTPWEDIGWHGEYRRPKDQQTFAQDVLTKFGQFPIQYWYHPTPEVRRVAVIVGGAAHYVMAAKRDGFDTFFTGELSEPSLHLAKDLEINLIGAGHDRTERDGIQALARQLSKKYRVPWEFVPQPNVI